MQQTIHDLFMLGSVCKYRKKIHNIALRQFIRTKTLQRRIKYFNFFRRL